MNWNQALFPSLKRRGGCAIKKMSRSNLVRADGVVRSAKSLGLKSFAELTTPSAALRRLRAFLLMPQIGVGTVVTRPSLRTVQVLFAHTALQSSVSMGEKVKMVQESIFAVGSSKRAD